MRCLKTVSDRLLAAAAVLALSACATSHPGSAAATTSSTCAASARVTGEVPEGAPIANPALAADSLRLDRSYTLTGDCGDEARSFVMEHILLTGDRIMMIGEDGSLSTLTQRPSVVGPSEVSPEQAPRLEGAPLVHAARVGHSRAAAGLVTSYVGVWRTGGKSIVASFRIAADGQASAPQPVFESDLPIMGVGYFPSPDSPSGQLGVVQQVDAGTARLLNYQWHHPGL